MNNLIPLHQTALNGDLQQTVDARELHAFLEVGKEFANWIKDRIEQYNFTQGIDFVLLANSGKQKTGFFERGGHNKIDYALSLDMVKHLGMLERSQKGTQIRQYFIDLEKQAKAQAALLYALRDELIKTRPVWVKIQHYDSLGLTSSETGKLLDLDKSTINGHKRKLRSLGLLPGKGQPQGIAPTVQGGVL